MRILLDGTKEQIEKVKAFLKANENVPRIERGLHLYNQWSFVDVQHKYKCTDEEANGILESSLSNEGTMTQIWEAIDYFAEMEDLPKIKRCFISNEEIEGEYYTIESEDIYIESHSDFLQYITDETEYKTIEEAFEDDFYTYTEVLTNKEN